MGATAAQVLSYLEALAGENEATLGSNNTTVNKYFNAAGQAYCGYAIWYAVKKAGSNILDGCSNPAYVPTIKTFLKSKYKTVGITEAQAGDIFAYLDDHVGFVYAPYSGSTVITLEGNSTVYKTLAEAKASTSGTGKFEGIGYKKRILTSSYTIYRPTYGGTTTSSSSSSTSSSTASSASTGSSSSSTSSSTASSASTTKVGKAISITMHELSQGNTGSEVKTLQRLLYACGIKDNSNNVIAIDGEFGTCTKQAVVKLQKELFPNTSSEWDGIMGSKSWTAALTELW